MMAEEALFILSLSLSLPELLLLALARPFWRLECQEWGRLFFMLALLPLLSPPSTTTNSVVTVLLLLKVVLYLAWELDLTVAWLVLRENMSMVLLGPVSHRAHQTDISV